MKSNAEAEMLLRFSLSKKSVFEETPSDEGKRSDVTGVNDSPADCQSRDRNRRNDLSAKLTGGETQQEVS